MKLELSVTETENLVEILVMLKDSSGFKFWNTDMTDTINGVLLECKNMLALEGKD